jgi:hypothetical protein
METARAALALIPAQAGERIADLLARCELRFEKRLTYAK